MKTLAYQLPPLAPLTGETGSGLWPTPQSRDDKPGQAARLDQPERHGSYNLPDWVAKWPGPLPWTSDSNEQARGALSPEWVELLMGYPKGWTNTWPSHLGSVQPLAWL